MNKRRNVLIAVFVLAGIFLIGSGCESECNSCYCVDSGRGCIEDDFAACNFCIGSYDGIVCNTDCLQCAWYPFMAGCGYTSPFANCEGEVTFGPTICGIDLCAGATMDFGTEYKDLEKSAVLKKAVEGEDYKIDSVEVNSDGGFLTTSGGGAFTLDFEEMFNDYLNLDYGITIRMTVRYTAYTELASAYIIGTIKESTLIGEDVEWTRVAYDGNSKEMIENGKVKQGDMIAEGEHVITFDIKYEYWELINKYYMEFTQLEFEAYKMIVEEN